MPVPSLVVLIRTAESLTDVTDQENGPSAFERLHRPGSLSGRSVPLSQRGHSQARREGVHLRNRFGGFTAVWCADTTCARATAEDLTLTFHTTPPIVPSCLLNEPDPGYPYVMAPGEIDRHFPWLRAYCHREGWFYARPPGGESVADVATNRVLPFTEQLTRANRDDRFLVVGGPWWICAARTTIEHRSTRERPEHGRHCGWLIYRGHPERSELQLHDSSHFA